MDASGTISTIEDALTQAGVSVARLCRRADIAESTWHRWKVRGISPRDKTFARVQAALADLAPGITVELPPREAA